MAKQKVQIDNFLKPVREQALISAYVDKGLHETIRQMMKDNKHQWTEVLEAAIQEYIVNYGGNLPSYLKR
jgi:hypothetical protein